MTIQQSKHLQAIAILMMLCLHLFNRDYINLFQPLIFVGNQPLSYFISLFCDACVPIFAFVSGYGLYFNYQHKQITYVKDNWIRLKKLYINYWIIIFIFAVGLGFVLNQEGYPGSILKLISNLSGLNNTYNGAWWFFTTYVFFVLTSKIWFQLLDKLNPYFYLIILLIIYIIAFYLRVYKTNMFENELLNYVQTQSVLYFCTLFQFMLGAFALKYQWNEKISAFRIKSKYINNYILIIGVFLLIIVHAFVPNFIIAPFTGLGFIFIFTQLKLSLLASKALDLMAIHSTNLWLIHMFFYMIYFPDFIYGFKYPLFIYFVLTGLCVVSSYGVNLINKIILKWV